MPLNLCMDFSAGDRDGHFFLHHDSTQDAFLHRELDPPHGADLFPLHPRLLPARRGRRESDVGHLHPAVPGRLPVACLQDPAPHLTRVAPHRQVPALHLPHEHRLHPSHRDHHQLELQGAQDTQNAQLDPRGLPPIPAHHAHDEASQEDASALDDGPARGIPSALPSFPPPAEEQSGAPGRAPSQLHRSPGPVRQHLVREQHPSAVF
ncbi:uncharacterized protein TNCT_669191 [Trichonephila clavata]|uniref:Uncharacterized protein n=1 Tax=Trichonephila clavata TaxID=2740835 RepID=A0A8X6LGU0_TRICU|nr:uncharacterized protein TNCT_669191 [Trichonephila clavata]